MSTEEDAIYFLMQLMAEHEGLSQVGFRWLMHAKRHLEDKLEASLRGE